MADTIEGLGYEAAARNLDRQIDALKDVRTRAGVLLAADFTAFLGRQAFARPDSGVVPWLALASFLLAAGAVLYVLAPSKPLRR